MGFVTWTESLESTVKRFAVYCSLISTWTAIHVVQQISELQSKAFKEMVEARFRIEIIIISQCCGVKVAMLGFHTTTNPQNQ